jgi:hypothetical protein
MLRIIKLLINFVKEVFSPAFCVFLAAGLILLLITAVFLPKSRLLENYRQEKTKEDVEKAEKLRQGIAKLRNEFPELDEYFKHQERCEAAIRELEHEINQGTPEAREQMMLNLAESVRRACKDAWADDAELAKED